MNVYQHGGVDRRAVKQGLDAGPVGLIHPDLVEGVEVMSEAACEPLATTVCNVDIPDGFQPMGLALLIHSELVEGVQMVAGAVHE